MNYARLVLLLVVTTIVACTPAAAPEAGEPSETSTESAAPEPAPTTLSVAIISRDLERSLAFYTEGLGMERVGAFDIDADFGRRSGLSNGVPFHVERLQFGEVGSTVEWKLVSFEGQAGDPLPEFIQSNTSVQYLTLIVGSVSEHVSRLAAMGVTTRGETPLQLPDGRTFALVQDPDGLFIELIGGE